MMDDSKLDSYIQLFRDAEKRGSQNVTYEKTSVTMYGNEWREVAGILEAIQTLSIAAAKPFSE